MTTLYKKVGRRYKLVADELEADVERAIAATVIPGAKGECHGKAIL